ncbi:MAG TPA: FemAB family PEP-CTERM system-associated protein [Gammaproteobacteria bacterium]|nr:FemAB family PEP-CTERM system-associated protein [Gammaproteobacteria bacterium]
MTKAIEVRQATAADAPAWDAYLAGRPEATPYHRHAWLEAVEASYGHASRGLMALRNGRVVGILPAVHMRRPLGGGRLCCLPYCDLGHAVGDDDRVIRALLDHLEAVRRETGAGFIEYRDTATPEETRTMAADDLAGSKVRMLLPLPDSSETLMSGFKSKLRSQIRKAEKNGLSWRIGNDPRAIGDFHHILSRNMHRLGSPVHGRAWFEQLAQRYADDLILSVVDLDGQPVAAGLVLMSGDRACIPWASTLSEYNRLAPNMLLYWSLLARVIDAGKREFDFGRSTCGEGTYRFKQQWGAKPVALKWSRLAGGETLQENAATPPGSARRLVEGMWRRLPLALTNRIGSRIRKHISL